LFIRDDVEDDGSVERCEEALQGRRRNEHQ
jgi:hypothetical protein